MDVFYRTEFRNVSELSFVQRQEMGLLYLNYYDGVGIEQFLADLEEKSEVLLLFHGDRLVGFTTMQMYTVPWQNQTVRIVYSGDTIVDKAHWGQQFLAFAWISRMGQIKREQPDMLLYWFVVVKGHRTFRYLPVFARSFYPNWNGQNAELKALADYLAFQKFGRYYNPESGVVEFEISKGHLKEEIALPKQVEQEKDSVRFFLSRNPGYRLGHELVCLCELAEENMKPFSRRLFNKDHQHEIRVAGAGPLS